MPTSVFLIRHGAYDHRPGPSEAASDLGLSALGKQQSLALQKRLMKSREIEAHSLFSSTLPRAAQTAEIIAPALGLKPQAISELCEWESGNEILGVEAFAEKMESLSFPERRQYRFAPGCETMEEFTVRAQTKLAELIQTHKDKTLVLVVHGGVVEAAFSYFLGFGPGPFQGGYPAVGNTSITLWRQSTKREDWILEYSNDTHHLRGDA